MPHVSRSQDHSDTFNAFRPYLKKFLWRQSLLGGLETLAAFLLMTVIVFWQAPKQFEIGGDLGHAEFFQEFFYWLMDHFLRQHGPYRYFLPLLLLTVILYSLFAAAQAIFVRWAFRKRLDSVFPSEIAGHQSNVQQQRDEASIAARKKDCSRVVAATVLARRLLPLVGIASYVVWALLAYYVTLAVYGGVTFEAGSASPSIETMLAGALTIGAWMNFLYFIRLHEFDPVCLWTSEMPDDERSRWRAEVACDFRTRTLVDLILNALPILDRRSIYAFVAIPTFACALVMLSAVLPYWPGHWLVSFVEVMFVLSLVFLIAIDRFLFATLHVEESDSIDIVLALSFSQMPVREALSEMWAGLGRMDKLTGVATRVKFEAETQGLIGAGRSFALAQVDMDEFKTINSIFRHEGGDRALRYVGLRLKTLTAKGCIVGRLGGDEFAIAVPMDEESALGLLRRWYADFIKGRERSDLGLMASYVNLSMGVAYHDASQRHEKSAQSILASLLDLADRFAFDAKAEGKGQVAYGPRFSKGEEEREITTARLRRLLDWALTWPSLVDVVSWEFVQAERALDTGVNEVEVLRNRRHNLILLDRRLSAVKRRLDDVQQQCNQYLSESYTLNKDPALGELASMGLRLHETIEGALQHGMRPCFREGVVGQLELFHERLNRFYAAFPNAIQGGASDDFVKELRKRIGVSEGPSSTFSSIYERIVPLTYGWAGVEEVVTRELEKLNDSDDRSLADEPLRGREQLLWNLDRKCKVLHKVFLETKEAIERRLNGMESSFLHTLLGHIERIIRGLEKKLDGPDSGRSTLDANVLISETLVCMGVLRQIVSYDTVEGMELDLVRRQIKKIQRFIGSHETHV